MLIRTIGKRYPKENSKLQRNYGLFSCDKCGEQKERIMQRKDENYFICNKCSKTKHGLYGTRIYSIWTSMKARCYNSNSAQYKSYGGQGITICDEWVDNVDEFYKWSMENGYSDDMTIDKDIICEREGIFPKIYSPSTCLWISFSENNREARSRQSKRVGQYTKEGELVMVYDSVLQASIDTKISQANINLVTLGRRKTAGGYTWKDLS